MDTRLLSSADELSAWETFQKSHPEANLWQSREWKTYQEALGREVRIYTVFSENHIVGSALVSIDRTFAGLSAWDIPKGPICNSDNAMNALLNRIYEDAKKDGAMVMYCSPRNVPVSWGGAVLHASERCEQSPATRILDLRQSPEEILAQMHQKGRYNIRVAERHGVMVRTGTAEDIDAFYTILRSTSARDTFSISPKSHYARFLTDLAQSFFLIAEYEGKPVAGFMGVIWNGTGLYYYGASDHAKRELMAPYKLQWEAMKFCKERGCAHYDLLGIAPPGSSEKHHWAGITAFKEKFGGAVIIYAPEQEVVLRPFIWNLLKLKRKILG